MIFFDSYYRQLYIFSLVFITSSCSTLMNQANKQSYDDNSKKVKVSDLQEVDLGTNVSTVFGGVNLASNSGLGINSLFNVSPQLSVSHLNNKLGTFDFNIYYPVYYKYPKYKNYFSSSNDVSKFGMNFTYSFPFISKNPRKEMYINAVDQNNDNYIIFTKSGYINKYNFRLSYRSNYSKYLERGFLNLAKDKGYSNIQYPNDTNLVEISQNSNSINFGLSYQMLLNTKFNAVDKDGKSYRAFLTSYITFYFDISYLIFSNTESNDVSFYVFNNNNNNGPNQYYSITDSPESYIDLRKYGFRLGFESNYSTNEKENILTSTAVELGTLPGYFSKAKQSFYFSFTLKFGLIKWH